MPLIETKGAASAQGFGEFAQQTAATYIEDVFSTWLYTGNSTSGGTQTITNSIDLSTKGGMVWIKGRSAASNHILTDTTRGAGASATNNNALASNLTDAEDLGGSSYDFLSAFNTDGFTVKQGGTTAATRGTNYNAVIYTSWTFAKQPKFFDVVTYTGNGTTQAISHNLGSVPGCIIVKCSSTVTSWAVYHRSVPNFVGLLNSTSDFSTSNAQNFGDNTNPVAPTSTQFTVGQQSLVNSSGETYVAYLFAHDAGGFGLSGTDNVISCGSFTTDGSGIASVTLGYEPQYLLVKRTNSTSDWYIWDSMRGLTMDVEASLFANSSAVEEALVNFVNPTATGFVTVSGLANSSTYIYIAIRRGPMKTPTSGTSVFAPVVYTGTNVDNRLVNMGLLTDMTFARQRDSASVSGMVVGDRLRGAPYLLTGSTNAENADADSFMTPTVGYGNAFSSMVGFGVGNDATSRLNISTTTDNQIAEGFRRAPGVFDVVCYTGTGVARTVTHNLGVVPELMIVKSRNLSASWYTYSATTGAANALALNTTLASFASAASWNDTAPTSAVFTVNTENAVNGSGDTYVAYLFASCPGVSKVGSYTGTGTTLQIDCGFTGGARFVLIKRTDSTGDWYVWDSARGIVAGNDPYLLLNSTAAEVTNTDYVDTYNAGFEISSTAPAAINANGGTFIFLAIA